MTRALGFGSSHRMHTVTTQEDYSCDVLDEPVIDTPVPQVKPDAVETHGGSTIMRAITHVIYRMYLIVKATVLHPFSATIVDFEKGNIELEKKPEPRYRRTA